MVFVGSNRITVNALNAETGQLVWRHRTANANFAQPLVVLDQVIVAAGDPWLTLDQLETFTSVTTPDQKPSTTSGTRLPVITALNPRTGVENWSAYSATGSSAMTPLYWDRQSLIFFVNGEGMLWALNAVNGYRDERYFEAQGFDSPIPTIDLGGYNGISSGNIYIDDVGGDIMVVGTAGPNKMSGINLQNVSVEWTQPFTGVATHLTGFAATNPAVSQADGLVIGSVIIDADYQLNTATLLAFGLDAKTGAIVWQTAIRSGDIPADLVASTPVIDATHAFFNNPLSNETVSVVLANGTIQWRTSVVPPAGKKSWGSGVLINNKLIQPIGPDLVTFNIADGAVLNTLPVGGSFTFNHPSIAGKTLYIGNSWGHVHAFPLGKVTGDSADNM